jgi:flagellar biosynthesis/type III secretory pathway protein FliH
VCGSWDLVVLGGQEDGWKEGWKEGQGKGQEEGRELGQKERRGPTVEQWKPVSDKVEAH